MKNLIDELHEFRKQIDVCIQRAGDYKISPDKGEVTSEYLEAKKKMQREIALVYTKLQEAKLWLNECLEMIGSSLPNEYQDKVE